MSSLRRFLSKVLRSDTVRPQYDQQWAGMGALGQWTSGLARPMWGSEEVLAKAWPEPPQDRRPDPRRGRGSDPGRGQPPKPIMYIEDQIVLLKGTLKKGLQ